MPPIAPPPIKIPKIILPTQEQDKTKKIISKGKRQGYDSYVREKRFGKMQETQVADDEPFNKATKKAMKAADNYTQRTVIIKKGGRTNKKDIKSVGSITKKFNKPASKSKLKKYGRITLVEKSKHAIDSRGEKLGIPYKAQKIRKAKPISRSLKL
jgi:hypothetical protein